MKLFTFNLFKNQIILMNTRTFALDTFLVVYFASLSAFNSFAANRQTHRSRKINCSNPNEVLLRTENLFEISCSKIFSFFIFLLSVLFFFRLRSTEQLYELCASSLREERRMRLPFSMRSVEFLIEL